MNKDLEKQIEEAAGLFCEKTDEEMGEVWSNTYDELPIKMAEFAMSSKEVGLYWKQEMYSEEDLYEILNKFRKEFSLHRGIQIMDFDIKNFIEQNKKK